MYMGLVSLPAVGEALLGEAEHANLEAWLDEGDHAIMLAGRGLYSFKGSGYVRGDFRPYRADSRRSVGAVP